MRAQASAQPRAAAPERTLEAAGERRPRRVPAVAARVAVKPVAAAPAVSPGRPPAADPMTRDREVPHHLARRPAAERPLAREAWTLESAGAARTEVSRPAAEPEAQAAQPEGQAAPLRGPEAATRRSPST